MWELDYKESWAQKNWCFWTVVLEKTLESPFHLKDISSEYSLEWLIFKLKLQYFGRLLWRADSFEKTLMLGKIEGGRRRGWQRMRWLDGITDSMDMGLGVGGGQEGLACCSHGVIKCRTWLSNWTGLIILCYTFLIHLLENVFSFMIYMTGDIWFNHYSWFPDYLSMRVSFLDIVSFCRMLDLKTYGYNLYPLLIMS